MTRAIHRLFWRGNLVNPATFIVWACMRPPALFVYNVLVPFQIAYGLQAIITRRFDQVDHYAYAIVFLAIIYCMLWGIGGVAICRNGEVGAQFVQRQIFTNYLQKDYEFYSNAYLGVLGAQATRLRDAFNEYNQIVVNELPQQAITIIASIAIIAYQSITLAVITIVSMTLILGFTIMSSKWKFKYRRILSQASSELAGVIGDALGHGTTVKSFAAENFETKRLNKVLAPWGRAQFWQWMSSIPVDIGRMLLATCATALLLIMTARLYEHHAISIAIVALVQLYVIKLISATLGIAEMVKSYEIAMGAAHQAVDTMLTLPAVQDKPKPHKYPRSSAIEFAQVSFHYADAQSKTLAVRDFTLAIPQGEKVGLVGYSGSGKTTLTKLLLRFMDVADGTITIDDHDIRDLAQTDLRSHIAYVPQEPLLFHRSIAENIAYGRPSAPRKAIIAAAQAAYVDEFVDQLPGGYDTLVGERGIKLSGGQRQRVAIARAILKNAPILVLDEATSALDSRSEKFIQKALWRLMEGRTALVIAHRLSTVQHMDKIVVVDKGRIVQTGTHEELLEKRSGIYAKLWAHQSGGYIGVPAVKITDEHP